MNKDKITLYLDIDDIKTLGKVAIKKDQSVSQIIRRLIRDYLEKSK
jgi:hypothetical protein